MKILSLCFAAAVATAAPVVTVTRDCRSQIFVAKVQVELPTTLSTYQISQIKIGSNVTAPTDAFFFRNASQWIFCKRTGDFSYCNLTAPVTLTPNTRVFSTEIRGAFQNSQPMAMTVYATGTSPYTGSGTLTTDQATCFENINPNSGFYYNGADCLAPLPTWIISSSGPGSSNERVSHGYFAVAPPPPQYISYANLVLKLRLNTAAEIICTPLNDAKSLHVCLFDTFPGALPTGAALRVSFDIFGGAIPARGGLHAAVVPWIATIVTAFAVHPIELPIANPPEECFIRTSLVPAIRDCTVSAPTYLSFISHEADPRFDVTAGALNLYLDVAGHWPASEIFSAPGSGNGHGGASAPVTSAFAPGDIISIKASARAPWVPCARVNATWITCPFGKRVSSSPNVDTTVMLRASLDSEVGHRTVTVRMVPDLPPKYTIGEAFTIFSSLGSADAFDCGGTDNETYRGKAEIRDAGRICAGNYTQRFAVTTSDPMGATIAYNATNAVTRITVSTGGRFGVPGAPTNRGAVSISYPPYVHSFPCAVVDPTLAVCPLPDAPLIVGPKYNPGVFQLSFRETGNTLVTVAVVAEYHGLTKYSFDLINETTVAAPPGSAAAPNGAGTTQTTLTSGCVVPVPVPRNETSIVSVPTTPAVCPTKTVQGYGLCPASLHGARCTFGLGSAASPSGGGGVCVDGYTGTPRGHLECLYGVWHRNVSGCEPGLHTGMPCSSPFEDDAYEMDDGGCAAGSVSGTVCAATCAVGYGGKATGVALCHEGAWMSSLGGCTPVCTLPPSVCAPGRGLGPQHTLSVASAVAVNPKDHVDPDSCELRTLNERSAVLLRCAEGYSMEAGSSAPAQCVGGTLTGGWTSSLPVCTKRVDAADKCGCAGQPLDLKVREGKVRDRAVASQAGTWECSLVDRSYLCTCRCRE